MPKPLIDSKHQSSVFLKIDQSQASQIVHELNDNQTLKELIFKDNRDYMGGKCAHVLAMAFRQNKKKNTTICTLQLDNNAIGGEGDRMDVLAQALHDKTQVLSLFLRDNLLDDTDIDAIAKHLVATGSLMELNLEHNRVTKEGAQKLSDALKKASNQLKILDLDSNHIGNNGAKKLASALKDPNCKLEKLVLKGNHISNNGAIALARGLKASKTIKIINLSRNPIGKAGLEALVDAVIENKSITRVYVDNLIINGLLQQLSQLRENPLRVNNPEQMEKLIADKLRIAVNAVIDVQKSSAEGRDVFSHLPAIDAVENNSRAYCLHVDAIALKSIVSKLDANNQLEHLELKNNRDYIGPEFPNIFAAALSKITHINPKLISLNLNNNAIGLGGAGGRSIDDMTKELARVTRIKALYLRNNWITDADVALLAGHLVASGPLTDLNLDHNRITAEGAQSLAKAMITADNVLLNLDLDSNEIGDVGVKHLAKSLQDQHCKLQRLVLQRNRIGDEGAKALALALSKNTTLQYLDLAHNSISDVGAKILVSAVLRNKANIELVGLDDVLSIEMPQALAELRELKRKGQDTTEVLARLRMALSFPTRQKDSLFVKAKLAENVFSGISDKCAENDALLSAFSGLIDAMEQDSKCHPMDEKRRAENNEVLQSVANLMREPMNKKHQDAFQKQAMKAKGHPDRIRQCVGAAMIAVGIAIFATIGILLAMSSFGAGIPLSIMIAKASATMLYGSAGALATGVGLAGVGGFFVVRGAQQPGVSKAMSELGEKIADTHSPKM